MWVLSALIYFHISPVWFSRNINIFIVYILNLFNNLTITIEISSSIPYISSHSISKTRSDLSQCIWILPRDSIYTCFFLLAPAVYFRLINTRCRHIHVNSGVYNSPTFTNIHVVMYAVVDRCDNDDAIRWLQSQTEKRDKTRLPVNLYI